MKKLIKTAFPVVLILVVTLSVNLTFAANGDPINEVNVSFTTGQNCNTMGDVVENISQPGLDWINSWLCNPADDSEAPVDGLSGNDGPILELTPAYDVEIRHADGPYFSTAGPPYAIPLRWDFPPIEQDNCQNGYAELGDVFDFKPGFEATREANTIFPSTGGTQHLTLQVTPREAMYRLDIPGSTQVGGELGDIAIVTNVEVISPYSEVENVEYNFDDYGFWIGIENPIVNKTYEIEITIEIGSVDSGDPSLEIVYMPFIQVKNIVALHDSGTQLGGSIITRTAYGDSGTWTWQANGDYDWHWAIDQVKDANLNGYAFCRVKDIITEGHFHLSNQTLHLYDGVVVPDGSQWINGNLFTFTHPGTPSSAEITSWSYVNNVKAAGRGTMSGSFTMTVHRDPCPEGDQCFEFGPIDGTISVSYNAASFGVPHPYDESEPFHYNFQGNFQITGGTGFYQGISGSGTISGTFHDHDWSGGETPDELEKWFDFVMIGQAMFRGK